MTAHVAAQFKHARFTPHDYLRDWHLHRAIDQAPCVTCGQFRALAKRRGWSIECMTEQVQGELEDPKATIKRIMSLADPNTVIPYPVLPDLYHDKAQMRLKRGECQCGCGQRAALAKTSFTLVGN